MMRLVFLGFGILFGFLMSRAGATDFNNYAGLFLLQNLHLLWVILVAVATGIIGMLVLRQLQAAALIGGDRLSYSSKPMTTGLVPGALLFGFGWGISGTCPGAAPAMLGEGKLLALPTIVGILVGTYLYGVLRSWIEARRERAPIGASG